MDGHVDPATAPAEFWEQHYRARAQRWSGEPNAVLVDVVAGQPPGTALDLGCGEGGDAVWLAQQGWRVTAVDISTTALGRLRARTAAEGVADRVVAAWHDLGAGFPDGMFDLVNAQFLQSPVALPRDQVLHRAAAAVADGGLLLVVDHASAPPWSQHRHEDDDHRFPDPAATLAALALTDEGWRREVVEVRARPVTGPDGQRATVTDSVLALRRVRSG